MFNTRMEWSKERDEWDVIYSFGPTKLSRMPLKEWVKLSANAYLISLAGEDFEEPRDPRWRWSEQIAAALGPEALPLHLRPRATTECAARE
jgi:hypothetical protein